MKGNLQGPDVIQRGGGGVKHGEGETGIITLQGGGRGETSIITLKGSLPSSKTCNLRID